jgi:hypothetical protein
MKAFPRPKSNPARGKGVDKMGEFVEVLIKWEARATRRDAKRIHARPQIPIWGHPGASSGCARSIVICGFAYASYEWRSEFGGKSWNWSRCMEEFARSVGVGRTLLNELIVGRRGFTASAVSASWKLRIERTLESRGLDRNALSGASALTQITALPLVRPGQRPSCRDVHLLHVILQHAIGRVSLNDGLDRFADSLNPAPAIRRSRS